MRQGLDKRKVSLIDFLESERNTLEGSSAASEIVSVALGAEAEG
jgi:hypothetical protein